MSSGAALLEASEGGDLNAVKSLLSTGCDIESADWVRLK
jgi:hypothetical protein